MAVHPTDVFREAMSWLERLTDRERTPPPRREDLGPETTRQLLGLLGLAAPAAVVVQVGGTKGKGTACLLMERLAEGLGLSTGTYLSPHMESVTERIRHRGRPVAPEDFGRAVLAVAGAARALPRPPSYFEVLTAAAMVRFAAAGHDLAVLEVGMGGRLDATTAVPHSVCAITGIALEHTEVLGSTEEAIAREKAGILREGRVCVTGASGAALAVVEAEAARRGARLLRLSREIRLVDVRPTARGFAAVLTTPRGGSRRLETDLLARPHLDSLALAAAALEEAVPRAASGLTGPFLSGLALRPHMEGRFEVVPPGAPVAGAATVVLDGAHTAGSILALLADVAARFPGRRVDLVFGCARDKSWREALSGAAPALDRAFVAPILSPRTEDPARIAEHLRALGVGVEVHPSAAGAFRAALARPGGEAVVLVTGSFYLVGEVRSALAEARR